MIQSLTLNELGAMMGMKPTTGELIAEYAELLNHHDVDSPEVTGFLTKHKNRDEFFELAGLAKWLKQELKKKAEPKQGWTRDTPTKRGYYWMVKSGDPVLVLVNNDLLIPTKEWSSVKRFDGWWWYGPIEPPTKPEGV